MLHAKFQGHRTSGSGEEDFKGFYHILAWRPYLSRDHKHLYKLSFPFTGRLHVKFGIDWLSGFREEVV